MLFGATALISALVSGCYVNLRGGPALQSGDLDFEGVGWTFTGSVGVQYDFFDKLRIAYSEAQVGWIPYAIERSDYVWDHHDGWMENKERMPVKPSTYYYGRVFGCFTSDYHGMKSLDEIGVDQVCFETDYPHTDTTWPNSKEYAEKMLADFDEKIAYKVLRGNAIKMLELDRV